MAKIILGMPLAGNMLTLGAAKGFYLWPTQHHTLLRIEASHSAATHTFNSIWTAALNMRKDGFTHLAWIHNDIEPPMYWLDILYDEMNRVQADVISSVIRIKDDSGITSTGLDDGDLWNVERLTMKQVFNLPETFSKHDTGRPLLLNNGLMLCDITKPWAEQMSFEYLNRNGVTESGRFFTQFIPDDWLCSRFWNDRGLSIWATRKVAISHDGGKAYRNDAAEGDWETDEAYRDPRPQKEIVCV